MSLIKNKKSTFKSKKTGFIKTKYIFRSIKRFFQDVWHVFKYVFYPIVMLIFGGLAFTVPDQAQDIFLKFSKDNILSIKSWVNPDKSSFITFFCFVWLWSFTIWYTLRLFLHLVYLEASSSKIVIALAVWTPRILGVIPFYIAYIASNKVSEDSTLPLVNFGISGILFLALTIYRKRLLKKYIPIKLDEVRWHNLPSSTQRGIYFLLFIAISFICYFSLTGTKPGLAEQLGPAAVVALGLSVWTFIGMVFTYFSYRLKMPIFLFIGLLFYFSSYTNDNHEVRYDEEKNKNAESNLNLPLDKEYFQNWLISRRTEIEKSDGDYKVYIIAGEGGGIRAAYWTGSVLLKFLQQDKDFFNHTFAYSTVSGSSLGVAVTQALYKDYVLNKDENRTIAADSLLPTLRRILGKDDHLSGITSALLFPDLVQKFLPFKVNAWDRAKWIEDSWSNAYQKYTKNKEIAGNETLDKSLLNLYENVPPYRLPAIFFNSTVAETGQKAIISNLRLTTESKNRDSAYFSDVLDFHKLSGKAMPLKTAASVSARFPLITPPATVFNPFENEPGAHFVDGGYFENTGLSTAMEILYLMNDVIDTTKANPQIGGLANQRKIKPVIIFLKNGDYASGKISFEEQSNNTSKKVVNPIGNMYETRTIVSAFIGAWGRGGLNTSNNVYRVTNKMIPKAEMYTIEMKRGKPVPLGWYLSEDACRYMDGQVDTLSRPKNQSLISKENVKY